MNQPTDHNGMSGSAPADGSPAELDIAYARASRADGSRPSLSARASIFANAQRIAAARAAQIADATGGVGGARAQRIVPGTAANESWWNWRAAAGLAGVAFAGVLALWLYRGNPTLQPPPQVAPQAELASPQAGATPAPESTLESGPEPARQRSATPSLGPAPSPLAAPPSRQDLAASAERAADSTGPAPAVAAVPPAPAPRSAPPAAATLLQRWFPQALDSDADGLQYWFLLDRNGAVLRNGQRRWQDLSLLQAEVEADLRGEAAPLRVVRVESARFVNRRGHAVELAYFWTVAD